MPLELLHNVNFGKSRTGLSTVGYTVKDISGSIVTPRTTGSVYELTGGMYAAAITFPDDFNGSVCWDTGQLGSKTVFATACVNYLGHNPNVDTILSKSCDISSSVENIATDITEISSSLAIVSASVGEIHCNVEFIKDIEGGRWRINTTTNQMIFYKNDNTTEVARFNLFDSGSNPTSECVFERVRTGTINEC